MKLRREASLGVGTILGLQLLLSMLAIALLSRMGPAIERILEENVFSEAAVEEMLAELASNPSSMPEEPVPPGFTAALRRAQDNVTEEEERPLIQVIERDHEAAFRGNLTARAEVIAALSRLSQVNRDSMVEADRRAKTLGQAGAWAAALLGALSLALGILTYRRLRLRLELPIEELRATTQRVRGGNLTARCSTSDGPLEVQQIAEGLNWLLDRLMREMTATKSSLELHEEQDVRRLIVWLLDREATPVIIVDAEGHRIATSQAALGMELPVLDDSSGSSDWELREIPNTNLRCFWRTTPAAV